MKIKYDDEKVLVYLYQDKLDLHNIEMVNKKIRELFIKLIRVYKLDFFGYNKVHLYYHKNYGSILEIENIYSHFNTEIIDLKLIIHEDTAFFFEFDDLYFNNPKIEQHDNKFYLNLDEVDNIYLYLEFGRIIYLAK